MLGLSGFRDEPSRFRPGGRKVPAGVVQIRRPVWHTGKQRSEIPSESSYLHGGKESRDPSDLLTWQMLGIRPLFC